MVKKLIISLIICLSLRGSVLNASGIEKKVIIIIDPQYVAMSDKLTCDTANAVNEFIFNIISKIQTSLKNNRNYDVVLTNSTKNYVDSFSRVNVANNFSGNILISVGVFCPKDDQKNNIEIVNSMIEFNEPSENSKDNQNMVGYEDIINDLKQDSLKKFNSGVDLSRLIKEKIIRKNLNISKEIKYEPIDILIGANMPATLIRVRYLQDKTFIYQLVSSIHFGINDFFDLK